LPGTLEVADVAKMEKVEATVRCDDAFILAMGSRSPPAGLSKR